jgi:hypothetical protein
MLPASVLNLPSLAISEQRVVFGSPSDDHLADNAGAAFVFDHQGALWIEVARTVAEAPTAGDQLGIAVALGGTEVFAGASGRDGNGSSDSGAVFAFDLPDCNGNDVPDSCPGDCPPETLACGDCNGNGIRDGCDVDCDSSGVPDECECVTPAFIEVDLDCCTNRFISVATPSTCQKAAARVRMMSLHRPSPPNFPGSLGADMSAFEAGPNCIEGPAGCVRWIGPPSLYLESGAGDTFPASTMRCQPAYLDWSGFPVIHATGLEIVPSSTYEVQFLDQGCDPAIESNYSPGMIVETARWGDVFPPFQDPSAPNVNQPNVMDLAALVDKLKEIPGAIPRIRAELRPAMVELSIAVNVIDVSATVDGIKGMAYPFPGPGVCGP